MEVDNTFVRSLNFFKEKIVVTVIGLEFVSQTSIIFFVFFKTAHRLSCLTGSLIDRCQIVTDTGHLLNHLYHYTNKYILVKPLSLICNQKIMQEFWVVFH